MSFCVQKIDYLHKILLPSKKWLKYSLPSLIYFEKCLTLPQPPTLNIALPMHTTGVSNRWRRKAIWHFFHFYYFVTGVPFFYLSLFFLNFNGFELLGHCSFIFTILPPLKMSDKMTKCKNGGFFWITDFNTKWNICNTYYIPSMRNWTTLYMIG